MTRSVAVGQDNVSLVIRLITDSDGTPAETVDAGSPYNTTIWYRREGEVVVTDSGSAADLAALTTAHTDWNFLHIRDGYYRVDYPDATFSSGVGGVLCGVDAVGVSCVAEYIDIDGSVKFQGLAEAATSTTTTFGVGINPYKGDLIYVIDGTGAGQTRLIETVAPEDSPGTGTVATHGAWDINISTSASTLILVPGDSTLANGGINVDATVSSRSTVTTGQVNAEVDTALSEIHLDHLMAIAGSGANVVDDSIIAQMVASGTVADWDDYNSLTDSLQGISESGGAIERGTAESGSTTTTVVDSARTESDTDYWKGCWIRFTSGNITNQVRLITGFTPASDTITFTPAVTQTVSLNTYEILPAGAVDVNSLYTDVVSADSLSDGAVDQIWQTVLTQSYAAQGAEGTASQILYTIQQFLTDADISGTTMTIRQLNGSSSAYVITLDSSTTPTDKNRTA